MSSPDTVGDIFRPILPEDGPDLVDGIVTVDDSSFATRVRIYSGFLHSYQFARYRQSTNISTRRCPGTHDANRGRQSAICELTSNLRAWGGIGTAPYILKNPFGFTVQFLKGGIPTARLAVLACVVCSETMPYALLLDPDSWVQDICPNSDDDRFARELSLTPFDRVHGGAVYVENSRAKGCVFCLRYIGGTLFP